MTLRERGVTFISAGLDKVPMVHKHIGEVEAAQTDLVTVPGQFEPKLVKMAPAASARKTEQADPAEEAAFVSRNSAAALWYRISGLLPYR